MLARDLKRKFRLVGWFRPSLREKVFVQTAALLRTSAHLLRAPAPH